MARLPTLFCFLAVFASLRFAEAAVDCSGGDGTKCESCSTLALCSGGSVTQTFSCQSDEMCEEGADGVGTCKLSSDTSRTNCQCSTFPSYIVDSYDPQKYILCFSATLLIPLTCEAGQIFDGTACVEAPATTGPTTSTPAMTTTPPTVTCTEAGLFPLLPNCNGYYACYDVGGSLISTDVVYCTSPQVFDPVSAACVASIAEPALPTCGTTDFVVADTVECNAFYVCAGGAVAGEKICCGEGEVFNAATPACEPDTGSVTCPVENPCFTGEIVKTCVPPSCEVTTA